MVGLKKACVLLFSLGRKYYGGANARDKDSFAGKEREDQVSHTSMHKSRKGFRRSVLLRRLTSESLLQEAQWLLLVACSLSTFFARLSSKIIRVFLWYVVVLPSKAVAEGSAQDLSTLPDEEGRVGEVDHYS